MLFRKLGRFVPLAHDREAIARPHDTLDFRNLDAAAYELDGYLRVFEAMHAGARATRVG